MSLPEIIPAQWITCVTQLETSAHSIFLEDSAMPIYVSQNHNVTSTRFRHVVSARLVVIIHRCSGVEVY